jgi:hypothetical protein
MLDHMARRVVTGAVSLALALTPVVPAFATQSSSASRQSADPTQVASHQEWGGWYSSAQSCAEVGRDYVHGNGAIGFTCRPLDGRWALWVIYDPAP